MQTLFSLLKRMQPAATCGRLQNLFHFSSTASSNYKERMHNYWRFKMHSSFAHSVILIVKLQIMNTDRHFATKCMIIYHNKKNKGLEMKCSSKRQCRTSKDCKAFPPLFRYRTNWCIYNLRFSIKLDFTH